MPAQGESINNIHIYEMCICNTDEHVCKIA